MHWLLLIPFRLQIVGTEVGTRVDDSLLLIAEAEVTICELLLIPFCLQIARTEIGATSEEARSPDGFPTTWLRADVVFEVVSGGSS